MLSSDKPNLDRYERFFDKDNPPLSLLPVLMHPLHSLLMGLYRYGAYYETAIPLGVERDMDFVRTQILKELENKFGVSEDEAEMLRSLLEETGVGGLNNKIDESAARAYNLALYEIVKESGLKE